jgi:hypothetical protein
VSLVTKNCPRCGRVGVVRVGLSLEIHWPPRRATEAFPARGPDRDACLRLSDLSDPDFGCGYDDASADACTGGAP